MPPDEVPAGQRGGRQCLSYAQLYIYDAQNELSNRLRFAPQLNREVTERLQVMLHRVNPFVRLFRTGAERLLANPALNLRVVFRDPDRRHNRTYNRPTANEVGGIIVDDGTSETHERDIIIERRGAPFPERISYMHDSYMPLQYPLLFPRGDLGWHNGLRLTGPNAHVTRRSRQDDEDGSDDDEDGGDDVERAAEGSGSLTLMRWFAYRLFERPGDGVSLRYGSRLFQQWLVDAYACIEQSRLLFIRLHQKQIRAELYSGSFIICFQHYIFWKRC